jgi:hypothetical protein
MFVVIMTVRLLVLLLVLGCHRSAPPAAAPPAAMSSSPAPQDPAAACAPALPQLASQHGPNITRIYLAPLTMVQGQPRIGAPVRLTARPGYVNQPAFSPDGAGVYFTWRPPGSQADLWYHDLATGGERPVTCTSEEEYVGSVAPGGRGLTAVRVGSDLASTLVALGPDGRGGEPLFPAMRSVAAYRWADEQTVAMVLSHPDAPFELVLGDAHSGELVHVADHVRATVSTIPGHRAISYVDDSDEHALWVVRLDLATRSATRVIALPDAADHAVWLDEATLLTGRGTHILRASIASPQWSAVTDLASAIGDAPPAAGKAEITRLIIAPDARQLAIVVHDAR